MMSKRETIILSVLINIGLLAILFLVAVQPSDDNVTEQPEIGLLLEEPIPLPKQPEMAPVTQVASAAPVAAVQATGPRDEVDDVLYGNADVSTEVDLPPPSRPVIPLPPTPKIPPPQTSSSNQPYIEVTVKKGDALEKIARANRSSVEEIKRLNSLASERLDIGQVLRVPVNTRVIASTVPTQEAAPAAKVVASNEPIYHVIKSGDNPWKIARQYKVKYEDILKLNNMNEEKARNLKIGEKIRVK
jgi:peptidoglycan DL-endopeptidase LytF